MWKKLVAVVFGVVVGYWLIDDFNPDTVRGKNVLLTGASTGLGEQMAYHYATLGANVVITARREQRLKEVIAKCRELGTDSQKFNYVVADMADLNSTQHVVKEAIRSLGSLDILVLNHIVKLDLGFWEGSAGNLSLVDKVLRVNFQSYVYLTSYSLPHLEHTSGSIIVISSLAAKMGQPFVSIYSASKFALEGFFGGLRQELKLKNSGISITLPVLGLIGTENAIEQLQNYKQDFMLVFNKPVTPHDTALAVIKGGALRRREIYFPRATIQAMVMLRDLFPSTLDYVNRVVYTKVS